MEIVNLCRRAFAQSRKMYDASPHVLSECRGTGGPFVKAASLFALMDATERRQYIGILETIDSSQLQSVDLCPWKVAEQAQQDDMAEDVLEPLAMRDPAHVGLWLSAKRRAVASAEVVLSVWSARA